MKDNEIRGYVFTMFSLLTVLIYFCSDNAWFLLPAIIAIISGIFYMSIVLKEKNQGVE